MRVTCILFILTDMITEALNVAQAVFFILSRRYPLIFITTIIKVLKDGGFIDNFKKKNRKDISPLLPSSAGRIKKRKRIAVFFFKLVSLFALL